MYGTWLLVSIIINIVLSGTIPVAFAGYRLPPSPSHSTESRRNPQGWRDTRRRLYEDVAMFLRNLCYILFSFLFWTLESVVWGKARIARARAHTDTHAHAREWRISRPLRSHVGPYTGCKLSKKVMRKMTMSRGWSAFPFLPSLVLRSARFHYISPISRDFLEDGRRSAPDSTSS